MKIEDMTPQELRELADQKEMESKKNKLSHFIVDGVDEPFYFKKAGVLKEDVFYVHPENFNFSEFVYDLIRNESYFLNAEKYEQLKKEIIKQIDRYYEMIKKGERAELLDDGWYCYGEDFEIEAEGSDFGKFVEITEE